MASRFFQFKPRTAIPLFINRNRTCQPDRFDGHPAPRGSHSHDAHTPTALSTEHPIYPPRIYMPSSKRVLDATRRLAREREEDRAPAAADRRRWLLVPRGRPAELHLHRLQLDRRRAVDPAVGVLWAHSGWRLGSAWSSLVESSCLSCATWPLYATSCSSARQ